MESLTILRGPAPPVEHPRHRTGRLLPCEERRPSALLVDASAAGLSTTPAASDRVSPGEGLPVEAAPRHPSGKGRHHANGGQLPGRCQLTTMAVSRPLFRWVMVNRYKAIERDVFSSFVMRVVVWWCYLPSKITWCSGRVVYLAYVLCVKL